MDNSTIQLGLNCAWLRNSHSLSVIRIKFHSALVTPLTNPLGITIHGFFKSYSLTSWMHNRNKNRVVRITVTFVHRYRENLRCIQEEQLQALPWGTPDTRLKSLLQQSSTTTYCDRLERTCVRKTADNQDRKSKAHRAELEEDPLMVDHVKSGTKVYILSKTKVFSTFCHTQLIITSANTFPISELSGWKHTYASIPPKTNWPDAHTSWTV